MKKLVSRSLLLFLAVGLTSLALANQHTKNGSWTGVVTDTGCGEKGAAASHADCAIKCVKEKGASWALYDPQTKAVFALSGDTAVAEKMAGKSVTVKGTLDKEKKTITVSSIAAAGGR